MCESSAHIRDFSLENTYGMIHFISSVNLYPEYGKCSVATISGGPLDGIYELHSLNLRWGPNDEEGTEHMVDNKRFAMEMQITFMRPGHRNKYIAADAGDAIMVSYIYQVI